MVVSAAVTPNPAIGSVTVRTHFQRDSLNLRSPFQVFLLNGDRGGPQSAPDGLSPSSLAQRGYTGWRQVYRPDKWRGSALNCTLD
jgi:hypothetical protein